MEAARPESVITVTGPIEKRSDDTINAELPTGEVELRIEDFTLESEADLLPSEPITVVLSRQGWIRAAKGHDVDAAGLSFRSGDDYLTHAPGRSNQTLIVLDSTGRSYTLAAHRLPSARGQGEPLTGSLNPADGARFVGVILGDKAEVEMVTAYGRE